MTKYSSSGSVLMEEFAQPTEVKNPSNTYQQAPEPQPSVAPYPGDFEDFPEIDPDPAPGQDPIDSPGIPIDNVLSPETSAAIFVGMTDQLQQIILTSIHKWKLRRKLGAPQDQERIHELLAQIEEGSQVLTDLELPERAKVRIVKRIKEKIDALPFTESEYDQLEEALILIIREMPQYQLPPSMALTLAMATIMAPRIMDAVLD